MRKEIYCYVKSINFVVKTNFSCHLDEFLILKAIKINITKAIYYACTESQITLCVPQHNSNYITWNHYTVTSMTVRRLADIVINFTLLLFNIISICMHAKMNGSWRPRQREREAIILITMHKLHYTWNIFLTKAYVKRVDNAYRNTQYV